MKWVVGGILTLTVAIGLAGGLLYTWYLEPIEEPNAAPDSLCLEDRLIYLALVGDLYIYEGDLAQAEARLSELGLEAEGGMLADLIEQYLDAGGRPEQMRNLAQLARDLGASGGILQVFAAVPTPTPEWTPTLPALPAGTAAPLPTVTPAPSFHLVEQTAICAAPGRPGRITVWVEDAGGGQLSGMEIVVSWPTGQDRFFTGLRPEWGAGYADFEMSARVEYDVALAEQNGDAIQGLTSDLSAGVCPTDTLALDWKLVYREAK